MGADRRREGRIDVQAAIEGEDDRSRSLASVRRARERERRQAELARLRSDGVKVVRDVTIPDVITVQELANRMAARGGEVVKALFRMGVMATLTQSIDADTAELVVTEFGRTVRLNGSRGTDHGTATVAFLIGGAVKGGRVLADWPGLAERQLWEARDLAPTTDLRAVMKGVLAEHLGLEDRVLGERIFPQSAGVARVRGLIG